ncbi:EpsG family protein [Cytobacillus pseudoceanisediminis]|uniref:EpsG family protein n=1 Tax=Cytobacillus pseudoceanisediminis TaxID=3051614 RepID=UPI003CED2C80
MLLILVGFYTDKEIIHLDNKRILNPNIYLFLFSYFLFVIAATRVGIGTDYDLYEGIYYGAKESVLELGWGFEWISIIFRFFKLKYQYFIAFNSLIFIATVTYFIYKYSSYKYISLITLLGTYSYFSSFNGFRQFTSISLVLLALILFLEKKKWITGALLFLFSIGIHRSSLMFIPLFFINYITITRKMFISIMFVCLFSFFVIPEFIKNSIFNELMGMNDFFQEKYTDSIHAQGEERGITNKMFFLFYWITTFKVIIDKINTKEKVNLFDKLFLIYFIVNSFFPYSNLVKRISYFFELMAIYMLPKFISSHKSKIIKNALKMLVILIFFIRTIYVLNQNGDGVVPYETILYMFE